MTPGSRYVQLLQNQPNANNGTITGGLAHILQQYMMGSQMGADQRKTEADEAALQGRLSTALRLGMGTPENTITWNQPTRADGTGGPTTTIPARPGDRSAMLQHLAGDPATAPMAFDLFMNQPEADTELVQAVDPATGQLTWVPKASAAGMQSALPDSPDAPTVRTNNLPNGMSQDVMWDGTGWVPIGEPYPRWQPQQPDMPSAGPFEGAGLDNQMLNLLLTGDPSSPEYLAAYNWMAAPKAYFDQRSGQMVSITPDMSAYRLPTSMAGGTPGATPPAAGTPPVGMTPPPTDPAMGPARTVTEERVGSGSMTEGQSVSAGYADRMILALPTLAEFEAAGTDFGNALASQVPLVGNYLVTPEFQQLDQARRNFLSAVLRKESGAVIAQSEMDDGIKMYFPVPGDSPAVIAQKKANREAAVNAMIRNAGPTYKRPDVEPGAAGANQFNDYLGNLQSGGNTGGWSIQRVQ